MKCLYRISSNSYKKNRLPNATKQRCLINFLNEFPVEEITVYKDRCEPELEEFLQNYSDVFGLNVVSIDGGSSAQSFRIVVDEALKLPDNEVVYLIEDDYLHLPFSRRILLEGIELGASYVSGYDHKDKYIPASQGGNPLIDVDGGEFTKVYLSKSSHWKLTNSTTLSFLTKVETLREDYDIWKKWCFNDPTQTYPNDYQCFRELIDIKGRSLITPIPGISTHSEIPWLSPLINWEGI